MDILERQLDHDRWATGQIFARASVLTDAQIDQEFDIGHRTLRATIDHILSAREGWTALMVRIQPPDHPDVRSIAYQTERHERASDAFAGVARRIRDEDRMDDTFTDYYDEFTTFASNISSPATTCGHTSHDRRSSRQRWMN